MVYGTVIQAPKSEGISHGDGQVVFLGTWNQDGANLRVERRLVSRTVLEANEALPGPMQKGTAQLKGEVLQFEKMRFRRDLFLDDDAQEILQGNRARISLPKSNEAP
jgi:hypothetical protein